MTDTYDYYKETLQTLRERGDLRRLPDVEHTGRRITASGRTMLNLSSNDYLGLATDTVLQQEFLDGVGGEDRLLSSSSSRLLTGNFTACTGLEHLLAGLFRREAALVFSSGYHMNTGILPALTDAHTLILADKLVHASIIDGIRLSAARCIRFRHQDYAQLERLLEQYHGQYPRIFIVTESIFSMDGDIAPLARLVELKRRYPGVMLYVDEAHAIGVRGRTGLGIAEEQDCIGGVDLLCGTFGKALASVGAYVVCDEVIRQFLINRMRTLIFTTALPPLNVAWTRYVVERLAGMTDRRERLADISTLLREAIRSSGMDCVSDSHIIPYIIGASPDAMLKADALQRHGFYVLPVRPPTVPEGTSRLRFSLTADMERPEIDELVRCLRDDAKNGDGI